MIVPPPVTGWNTRDPLTAHKLTDAIVLDNWFPDVGSVRVRPGYSSHATGIAGNYVETLMEYSPPSGTNKLFAAGPTDIYDVTAGGAVGAAVVATLTNGRHQHTLFSTSAGTFLCIVNGADGYRTFDGTTWTDRSASVTGATASSFSNIMAHMNRLWFSVNDSLEVYYLPVSSVQGAATLFDLRSYCRLGGSILAMASWTRDGGEGMDDLAVFLTTKGEVLVYEGLDPASTFSLTGIFRIPEPIGRRCVKKIGGDLAVLTKAGVVPLSGVLNMADSALHKSAITDAIAPTFRTAGRHTSTLHGWQIAEYAQGDMLICNVPQQERIETYQYVMNTRTGAWCRFKDIEANCWGLLGTNLYFGGSDGKVYRFDPTDTESDNGTAISVTMQTAYSDFKRQGWKLFHACRALVSGSLTAAPQFEIKTDFDTSAPTASGAVASAGGTLWDEGDWDTSEWAGSTATVSTPSQVVSSKLGRFASVAWSGGVSSRLEFNGIDVAFEEGGWL